MKQQDGIVIRSYGNVFRLERRLHKIDRWRIPLPYGVPLRGIAYAVCVAVVVFMVGRLPLVGGLVESIAFPLRFLVVPGVAAYLLTQLQVDGRPAHRALLAELQAVFAPLYVSGFRAHGAPERVERCAAVVIAPDGSGSRYRRGELSGPARLLLRYPASARQRGRTLELRQSSDRPMWNGKVIDLAADQRLEFR